MIISITMFCHFNAYILNIVAWCCVMLHDVAWVGKYETLQKSRHVKNCFRAQHGKPWDHHNSRAVSTGAASARGSCPGLRASMGRNMWDTSCFSDVFLFDPSLSIFWHNLEFYICMYLCLRPDGFSCFMSWVADQTDRFQEGYAQWADAQIKRTNDGVPRQNLAAVANHQFAVLKLLKSFMFIWFIFIILYHLVFLQHDPHDPVIAQRCDSLQALETHLVGFIGFGCFWNTSRQIQWLLVSTVALFQSLTPFVASSLSDPNRWRPSRWIVWWGISDKDLSDFPMVMPLDEYFLRWA